MITRRYAARGYGVTSPGLVTADGVQRTVKQAHARPGTVDYEYPISRPSSSPTADRAPLYLHNRPVMPEPVQHDRRAAGSGGMTPLSLRTNTNPGAYN